MKPCSRNRKSIALLALGALDAEPAAILRKHLENCDGCHCYLDELSNVTATLNAAEMKSEVQPTESFHRRVVSGVRGQQVYSTRQSLRTFVQRAVMDWRVAVPIVCGFSVVLLLAWLLISRQKPEIVMSETSKTPNASRRDEQGDFVPTVGNYHTVANQSLDSFDRLLTKQAGRKVPPAPLYTASVLATGRLSD